MRQHDFKPLRRADAFARIAGARIADALRRVIRHAGVECHGVAPLSHLQVINEVRGDLEQIRLRRFHKLRVIDAQKPEIGFLRKVLRALRVHQAPHEIAVQPLAVGLEGGFGKVACRYARHGGEFRLCPARQIFDAFRKP